MNRANQKRATGNELLQLNRSKRGERDCRDWMMVLVLDLDPILPWVVVKHAFVDQRLCIANCPPPSFRSPGQILSSQVLVDDRAPSNIEVELVHQGVIPSGAVLRDSFRSECQTALTHSVQVVGSSIEAPAKSRPAQQS